MLLSEINAFLEMAYQKLNEYYYDGELTPVVITIQSSKSAYGHYTLNEIWTTTTEGYHEINLGAETINRPISATIGTLLHEMVHHHCLLNDLKDTSRNHTYHNKTFREVAESHGIHVDYDKMIGWSITSPSDETIEFIKQQGWQDIDLSRTGFWSSGRNGGGANGLGGSNTGGEEGRKKKQGVRKYICPICKSSCRATKSINIGCLDCGVKMVLAEDLDKTGGSGSGSSSGGEDSGSNGNGAEGGIGES